MDENKLNMQAERAAQAKALYQHPFMVEAFDSIEQTILESWKGSAADEGSARDNAYVMYRLLQNLRQKFIVAIATGEAADKQLLQIRDKTKLRRMINV
jgi:hypothetical protein